MEKVANTRELIGAFKPALERERKLITASTEICRIDSYTATMLRPATLDDIAFMATLHAASWREVYADFMPPHLLAARNESYRAEYWLNALTQGRRGPDFSAVIAEAAGRKLGFIYAIPGTGDEAGGEVESLFVAADARGRGLGRKLLAAAARWFEARKLAPIVIWAFEGNPHRRFYADLGGDPRGRRDEDFPTGEMIPLIGYFWPEPASLLRAAEDEAGA
jgi:GNAT superfamily N-acetyltransferase